MIQKIDNPGDWKDCRKARKLTNEEIQNLKKSEKGKKNKIPDWSDCACPITCEDCECLKKLLKGEKE